MADLEDAVSFALANPDWALDELDKADCEESLLAFTRRHWGVLEPATPFVGGWAVEAICEHLEAITSGDITRLLINVPPGFSKSMLTNVFWPAWEWGPKRRAFERYLTFSYAAQLTERDNRRFRDLLQSPDYTRLWGDRFSLEKRGEELVTTDKTGWKIASSVKGVSTGERGSRVLFDDPHNVKQAESDPVREETVRWFREGMSNRLNDMEKSAICIIMQRVHENDVSGAAIEMGEYEHLMIPMEWDGRRYHTSIGWTDPRDEDGELAWEERFSAKVVAGLKTTLGPYGYAGQYQQAPTPRGGGIFRREWWQLWGNPDDTDDPTYKTFPACEYIVASLDTAYTEKQENDYSALTVWGVFRNVETEVVRSGTRYVQDDSEWVRLREAHIKAARPKVILMHAWRKRLPIRGPDPGPKQDHESPAEYDRRCKALWGLVEWTAHTCRRFKVDRLLIESKAAGISVSQELRLLHSAEGYAVELVEPKGDKTSRAYSVQGLFSGEMIYAPEREWADMVITEMASFPRAPHDDLVDSATQALRHLRDVGFAQHEHEIEQELNSEIAHTSHKAQPLYPA